MTFCKNDEVKDMQIEIQTREEKKLLLQSVGGHHLYYLYLPSIFQSSRGESEGLGYRGL